MSSSSPLVAAISSVDWIRSLVASRFSKGSLEFVRFESQISEKSYSSICARKPESIEYGFLSFDIS